MLSDIFKAYDVRGIAGKNFTADIAYKIGRAFVYFLKADSIIVGRDMRVSGEELAGAFIKGAVDQGAHVIDIGLVSTDTLYFASGHLRRPGAMFTASHNPPQYNGIKFCKEMAIPMNQDTGLADIKELVASEGYLEGLEYEKGTIENKDVLPEFAKHVQSFVDVSNLKPLKIACDAGNGMGGKLVPAVYEGIAPNIIPLFFELDGTFPNHLADPSKFENLVELQKTVKEKKCDYGMAFDGDADRIFFVDEKGDVVNSSLLSALIVKNLLEKNPKSTIIHNIVTGRIVKETIEKFSGKPVLERVGHSFIKDTMRNKKALFGCEHSAHYYYRDNFNADSGLITSVLIAEIVSKENKPLSELLAEFKVYATLEETNFNVADKQAKMDEVLRIYKDKNPVDVKTLDGISIAFDEYWFNVRPSNTEPLLRLNMEAKTPKLLKEKKEELAKLLS